jgi:DNA-binding transcriptional LysR family regulator
MTFHQLQLLSVVVKHLSISSVSRELRISQPAVSGQLKVLQQYFNLVMLRKNGRKVELTDDGRRFWHDAEPVIRGWERLEQKYLGKSYYRVRGTLALGGTIAHAAVLLPSLVAWFKRHQRRFRRPSIAAPPRIFSVYSLMASSISDFP